MKRILLFAVVLVITSVISFAGGSKEPAKPAPVMAKGEWMTFNDHGDKGSSVARMETKEEEIDGKTVTVHKVTGNVTTQFQYGFAGWGLDADSATMDLYKTAESLSFYILGDGKKYTIKFKISSVEDYAYHEYTFETTAGEAQFMEVPIMFFSIGQPAWGAPVKFDPTLVTGVEWQTHESWRLNPRNNPFEIKMWDFMIHPAPAAKKKAAAKPAAPAQKPGELGSFDLVLKDNFQYGDGYQGDIRVANLLNGHKLSVGDSFTVKFTYTASRDLEEPLEFGFVDQTPAAEYWRALSWEDGTDMPNHPATKAGESVTIEMTFKIVKNATGAAAGANTFVFSTKGAGKKGVAGSGVKKPVTLTFKEFTLVKN